MRDSLLQQVDLFTGQFDNLRRRIEGEWGGAGNPAEILRKRYLVDNPRSFPVDALRSRLEEAGRMAPEDDRVWLGKAYLAIRTARFADAEDWLEALPPAPAGGSGGLAGRPGMGDGHGPPRRGRRGAPAPAGRSAVARGEAFHARLDRRAARGRRAEQDALTRWVERAPGELNAVARLIGAESPIRPARRGRRSPPPQGGCSTVPATTIAVRWPIGVPTGHFDELGRLAEVLGRRFEARGWWTLALRESPGSEEARGRARPDRSHRARSWRRPIGPTPRRDRAPWPRRWPISSAGLPATRPVPSSVAAVPVFRDDAQAVGLRFVYENDPTPLCRMPETMGGGVGLLDYDGDGWLDVYAVQGGKLPNDPGPPPAPQGDRLFRNRGDGTFEDVTAAAGLMAFPGGYGHGVTVGDYDNDGRPDLFVTRWRSYALYRNRGDGTFEDATTAAGLGGNRDWPTSAAFADLDGDGDLDLYVCHYSDWDPRRSPLVPTSERSRPLHLLRPAHFRGDAGPRLPQRRGTVRRRVGSGGHPRRRSRRPGPRGRRRPPRRR